MEKKVLEIIDKEDKKNPLTDKQIADMLKTTRENITQLRINYSIPNSRERRKKIIEKDIIDILKTNKEISDRKLIKELIKKEYKISRYAAVSIKRDILKSNFINTESIQNKNNKVKEIKKADEKVIDYYKGYGQKGNEFKKVVGYNKSLKLQVSQAKAAVMYPPHGLHTLLLGPSGVGKSYFAEVMYNFALSSSIFPKKAPFIVFNCADYADNPQLLLAQLFGYTKGAFTGANTDKDGIVEKANGGILFLDEVHRLPKEGQEILFYLLDKNQYRRLGEVENSRKVNVMIIAATTEEPKSSLLVTFTRRIPMIIEIPPIRSRTLEERYELIKGFFSEESYRIGKKIVIKFEVIKVLMLYECAGNIGQIKSDIQVACARGFLELKTNNKQDVVVEFNDLPNYVRNNISETNKNNIEINEKFNFDLVVNPDSSYKSILKYDRYIIPYEIYEYIEEKFNELSQKGLEKKEINNIVSKKVEFKLQTFARKYELDSIINKDQLGDIVDKEIINISDEIVEITKKFYPNLKNSFYYCINIHLNSTYERLKQGKKIKNPQIEYIKLNYSKEFKVAKIISKIIKNKLNINLPQEEIGVIAMYIKTFSNSNKCSKNRVAVIVLTHGYVGKAMVEVVNKLLGIEHAVGIEMDLNENPKIVLERTIDVVEKVNEGKGCIILVDMGSLINFGHIITKKTGIPTKVIDRVDTIMVLEAVRKSVIPDNNLEKIGYELENQKKSLLITQTNYKKKNTTNKIIITLCITGEGTALKIKKYIENIVDEINDDIKIKPLGFIGEKSIEDKIYEIQNDNNILFIVGTIDPNIKHIPFISFNEVLNDGGINKIKKYMRITNKKYVEELLDRDLIIVDKEVNEKNEAIDILFNALFNKNKVQKEFLLSVYKREVMGSTVLNNRLAIPHGEVKNIKNPAIAILKLKKSILWSAEKEVDFVFMLALKEENGEAIKEIYKVFSDKEKINELKNCKTSKEIKDKFMKLI